LRYVGHSGSGFTEKELHRVAALLEPLAVKACPFMTEPPHTNERPHWVRPELIAEVKFSEWTADGLMRHPIFLGLRDDVRPASVSVETAAHVPAKTRVVAGASRKGNAASRGGGGSSPGRGDIKKALAALEGMDPGRGGRLPVSGDEIEVTNLGKALWTAPRITKGQLLRYYLEVAPYILPVVDDRPLVMRRFPDGVDRPAFFQHRAPDAPPTGVRVEEVEDGGEESRRLIGGSLATLAYMVQLAAISQDPWFSRCRSIGDMDHVAIDLDPTEGTTFATVLEVARRVRDELVNLKVASYPKTSGARGLHIYVPMRPGTSYQAGLLFGQIVATVVARRFPKIATVERAVQRRARGTVYLDYLQNIQGKTLACAYSARASAFAGASTPLAWDEVDAGVDPRDFTILTLPARLREVGDLWGGLRQSKGVDLRGVLERAQSKHGKAKGRNKEDEP
ncbi:MAG TPA: hypothetical protein VFH73_18435, partial [Polyangia bacterium]|nr:hypothetical protein [Polyangia bacterium]